MNNNNTISTRKKPLSTALKIASFLLCIYFFLDILFFDTYSFTEYRYSKKMLKNINITNEEVLSTNAALQKEIELLKNDSHYIEQIARRQYSMVKPGDTVYMFRKR